VVNWSVSPTLKSNTQRTIQLNCWVGYSAVHWLFTHHRERLLSLRGIRTFPPGHIPPPDIFSGHSTWTISPLYMVYDIFPLPLPPSAIYNIKASTKLIAIDRLRSGPRVAGRLEWGIRVSASFQIFALIGRECPTWELSGQDKCPGGICPRGNVQEEMSYTRPWEAEAAYCKQAVWPPGSADTVCPRPPLTLTFDRLTLKLGVASKVRNLPSKYGHARPLGSWIIRYLRDGRADGRTDKSNDYCSLPYGRGIITDGVDQQRRSLIADIDSEGEYGSFW